jgi:hypothetical protein
MSHVILLGDSIFDNGAYVERGQPDVVQQVRARLPQGRASLLAVDGAVTRDVEDQLKGSPADASHFIVSVGGNDALGAANILFENVRSVAEALVKLSAFREQFAADYRAMLDAVLEQQLPTAVCTIYDGCADSEIQQRVNITALSVFNDVITREAFRRGLTLIDLRLICNEPLHYANPIEPSTQGGDRIAAAIVELVTGHSNPPRSQVFTSAANQERL